MSLLKVALYGTFSVPSAAFLVLTTVLHASDGVLWAIAILQVLLPWLFDGAGTVIDNASFAVMGLVMSSGMATYIAARRTTRDAPPFYEVLANWNASHKVPSKDEKREKGEKSPTKLSRSQLTRQSRVWMVQSLVYLGLSVPVMSFVDGWLRICAIPPKTVETALWTRLPPTPGSMAYHLFAGIILHLHVWMLELFGRVGLTVLLWLFVAIGAPDTYIDPLYAITVQFLAQRPLFDKPWLAHSPYDLWSTRWHQLFRPGFRRYAYLPVRALFTDARRGRVFATIAVFAASGLMHEYILIAMAGPSRLLHGQFFRGILGQQLLFFLVQGVATILTAPANGTPSMPPTPAPSPPPNSSPQQSPRRVPLWLARALTLLWLIVTAPLFIDPYLRIGVHREAALPFYPHTFDTHIGVFCPFGT
ncbi:membrane bound O-acyl transferase family-domain-containing protein [Gongronella butleri]|nr:membrane bound O-acyl transferase family-domain-containing protein [Gongronella butleri]